MKLGLVSDTHGFFQSWILAYDTYLSTTHLILHMGDILYCSPGYNPLTSEYNPGALADHLNSLKVPMVFCRGDNDSDVDQKKLSYPIMSEFTAVYVDGLCILMHHGEKPGGGDFVYKNRLTPDEMELYARRIKADIFVMGRTHQPIIEDRGGIIHVNPGSPTHNNWCSRKQYLNKLKAHRSINIL